MSLLETYIGAALLISTGLGLILYSYKEAERMKKENIKDIAGIDIRGYGAGTMMIILGFIILYFLIFTDGFNN